MDDADETRAERRSFKQRLRFNGFGCCGAAWGFRRTTAIPVRDGDEDEDEDDQEPQNQERHLPPHSQQRAISVGPAVPVNNWDPVCAGPVSAGSGMNLAAALAAERQFRAPQDADGGGSVGTTGNESAGETAPGTPMRVSLMRLLEETEMDGCDAFGTCAATESEKTVGGVGSDSVCCVCMGRKKGAAFIPCGHTFCRVCSREVWLNRGSCPLCNRSILEILDIF